FGLLHRFYPYSFGVFLLHPLILYPVRNLMGLPDTVAGVALHAFVMPLAYAVVCAVITWPAVKIPGVRTVFGEGGPRNPYSLPRAPRPSRRRRPRPGDPADAQTDSVQPPRPVRAPEPDLGT